MMATLEQDVLDEFNIESLPADTKDRVQVLGNALVQQSALMARQAIAARGGQQFGGDRDVYEILGYKKKLGFDDYYARYIRDDIAGRIVDMPAQETWRNEPTVSVSEDSDGDTFVEEWEDLAERLRFYHYAERVDRLSGIGEYGVILIGIHEDGAGDGSDDPDDILSQPVGGENGEASLDPEDIIYLSVFHQGSVDVESFVEDVRDPRYGLPEFYEIDLTGKEEDSKRKTDNDMVRVHWTRVIHVADDKLEDEVHGRPRLERVWNRLDDLTKISGGSAEMFWQNVASTWHVDINPDYEIDGDDLEALEEKIIEAMLGLRRLIQTEGVDKLEPLSGQTPDPSGVFGVLQSLIASAAEIPQRILFGAEAGELASSQDKSEWHGRIAARQTRVAEPEILRAFIDRLVMFQALTPPEDGYEVNWSALSEPSQEEMASAAEKVAKAAAAYSPGAPEMAVALSEFRAILGLPEQKPEDDQMEDFREEEDEESQAEVDEFEEGDADAAA